MTKMQWGICLCIFAGILYLGCQTEVPDRTGINNLFPIPVTHEILGTTETCVQCHNNVKGLSPYHQPESIGCTPCHRGDPTAESAELAHRDMILIPGNLYDLNGTCGATNCHPDLTGRIRNSLMTTMSGVVAVDRFVFGTSPTLDTLFHIRNLNISSPADMHLRQQCASCHLGNEKTEYGPITEKARGGGCNACHLQYDDLALNSLRVGIIDGGDPFFHPQLNVQVDNGKCFGCHSRSGRISTSYEGWHETRLDPDTITQWDGLRKLQDGRVFRFVQEDVHHKAGLACIDCHSSTETMGDGKRYMHKEQAVRIRCTDCHFYGEKPTATYAELDEEAKTLLAIRGETNNKDLFLTKEKDGDILINARQEITTGQRFLKSKLTGSIFPLNPPDETCTRGKAHDALSCEACHTAWTPQCIGCHTTYETEWKAWDHLAGDTVHGKWVEYLGAFFADPPTLGVMEHEPAAGEEKTEREIKTFIPGMIMTLDQTNWPSSERSEIDFYRLFSPISAHTVNVKGRTCENCHTNSLAIGYGRGILEFDTISRQWGFDPAYIDRPEDGLPEDAWIGFMENNVIKRSTRHNARPFSRKEQQRILEVGACLSCHDKSSTVMNACLENFDSMKNIMDDKCRLPIWN